MVAPTATTLRRDSGTCSFVSLRPCTAPHRRQPRATRLHVRHEASAGPSVQTTAPAAAPQVVERGEGSGQDDDRRRAPQRAYSLLQRFTDANFPADEHGRTYHLGTRRGEVANRVLSVGSAKRARLLAEFLQPCQPGHPLFYLESSRGFITITGLYQGVPVSIICTHMGMPNMDFVIRETKAVVDGQLAVVRIGTCGGLQPSASLGTVVLACPGSICVRRNPDAFQVPHHPADHLNGNGDGAAKHLNGSGGASSRNGTAQHSKAGAAAAGAHYQWSRPVPADSQLTSLLESELHFLLGEQHVARGLNASADSFYSSQGRLGTDFEDENESLIEELVHAHPDVLTLEMETFHMLDLARCSRGQVVAAAAAIVLAQRQTNEFLDSHALYLREKACGAAALNALIKRPLQVQQRPGVEYVWD